MSTHPCLSCVHARLRPAVAFSALLAALSALHAQSIPAPATATEEPVKLSEFAVTTTRDVGYGARSAIGGTRLAVDFDKTPTPVIVVNEEFLRDMAALDTTAAIKYVSGMKDNGSSYNGQVTVRGFQEGSGVSFRDGLPLNLAVGGAPMTDYADIERLEIIKGPNGVLYGSHVPGGLVNAISRKPLAQRATWLRVYAGDWNLMRADVDTTGPAGNSDKLFYRFIISAQEGETFHGGPNDKLFIAPSVLYRLTPATEVSAKFTYYNVNIATSRGSWFADRNGAVSTFIPVQSHSDEDDEHREHWKYLYEAAVEYRFNSDWQLRVVGRVNLIDENKPNYNKVRFNFVDANGTTLGNHANFAFSDPGWRDIVVDRVRVYDLQSSRSTGVFADLVGNFSLGVSAHKILASAQYGKGSSTLREWIGSYPSTSVLNVTYRSNPLAVEGARNLVESNRSEGGPSYSFAVQDNIGFLEDRLIFSLGTRYDDTRGTGLNNLTGVRNSLETTAWSSKAGVVVRTIPGASIFYNYAETFAPVGGTNTEGVPFSPQNGIVNEGGVKLDLLDGKLIGTVSYFELTQDNFIRSFTADLTTGRIERRQSGTITSKGYEADIAWQPTPAFTALVALGDLTSEDERGLRVRNVSQGVNFKALAKYSFVRDMPLKGLSLGAGYVRNGESAGDSNDTFTLPGYHTWDAFAAYQRSNWRVQFNISNLTDEIYAGGSVLNRFIWPGAPRAVMASAEFKF